jgi:hypothetical protein
MLLRCLIISVKKYFTSIQPAFLGRAHHGVDQVPQLSVVISCFLNGITPFSQLISDSIPKINAPTKAASRSVPITIENVDFGLSSHLAHRGIFSGREHPHHFKIRHQSRQILHSSWWLKVPPNWRFLRFTLILRITTRIHLCLPQSPPLLVSS